MSPRLEIPLPRTRAGRGLTQEAELDGQGAVVSRFIYGNKPNVPELVVQGSEVYRVVTDQLGSPLLVVNIKDADDVLLDAKYDEWGRVQQYTVFGLEGQPWPIPFGFAGGLYDEDTGLVRFGARDYDPAIGRWTAKDPILFGGRQANLYIYVHNNPINLIDPPGLWGVSISVGGGFAAALGSGLVPVGGGGGSIGFFVGTEGFGTLKSVHYTNGAGAYAGAGASIGTYHGLDRLEGYGFGGKVVAGSGLIGGGTVDFTADGKFAAASLDLGGGAGLYGGGTISATSVSNWFEEMREFFLRDFRKKNKGDCE